MKNYEKRYHLKKHRYLIKDKIYYETRAKIALHDYFSFAFPNKDFSRTSTSVLDFGCGLGQNTFLIKNSMGYDPSEFAINFCRKKGKKAVNELRQIKGKRFDVVLSAEVLEHVENPLHELENMWKYLKKKGKLILVLPIDKWKKPDTYDSNNHLYNWNFNTITNLLVKAGFHPIKYKIVRRTGFYKLLPYAEDAPFWLYLLLTKLTAMLNGSKHMLIIARKK